MASLHKPTGKSCYARFGKKPFRYSPTYEALRAAQKRNDSEAVAELTAKHAEQFNYTPYPKGRDFTPDEGDDYDVHG
jgi:hypothetical protein